MLGKIREGFCIFARPCLAHRGTYFDRVLHTPRTPVSRVRMKNPSRTAIHLSLYI